jgi:hypothetical protein
MAGMIGKIWGWIRAAAGKLWGWITAPFRWLGGLFGGLLK